jgi:hypothetical protein
MTIMGSKTSLLGVQAMTTTDIHLPLKHSLREILSSKDGTLTPLFMIESRLTSQLFVL